MLRRLSSFFISQQNEGIVTFSKTRILRQKAGNRRHCEGDPGQNHEHHPSGKFFLRQNDVKEFGTVISIGDGIARVVGLNKVQAG